MIGTIWALSTADDDGSTGAAYTACKRAATAQLTNPATADFQISGISIEEGADGLVRVSGPLKAKTGFGVERSLYFTCTATRDGLVREVRVR